MMSPEQKKALLTVIDSDELHSKLRGQSTGDELLVAVLNAESPEHRLPLTEIKPSALKAMAIVSRNTAIKRGVNVEKWVLVASDACSFNEPVQVSDPLLLSILKDAIADDVIDAQTIAYYTTRVVSASEFILGRLATISDVAELRD